MEAASSRARSPTRLERQEVFDGPQESICVKWLAVNQVGVDGNKTRKQIVRVELVRITRLSKHTPYSRFLRPIKTGHGKASSSMSEGDITRFQL